MPAPDDVSAPWRPLLERHGLASFEALWDLDVPDVDEPNRRGSGWSRVARLELADDEATRVVFVKRQEEWWIKNLPRNRFACVAEAANLRAMRDAGLPVPECVFVGTRVVDGRHRGVLVTAETPGVPLDVALRHATGRSDLIRRVAGAVARLHRRGWRHCSLYPKHVLVSDGGVSFIDVERSRRWPWAPRHGFRDLDSLNRRTVASRTDRLRFLLAYAGIDRPDRRTKRLFRRLARRYE